MEKFAARLTELRESRSMTKKELAALLNVSAAVVSQYEADDCMPGYDILIAMSREFDVSTDYLLGLTENKNIAPKIVYANGVSYKQLLENCAQVPYDYRDTLLLIIDSLRQKGKYV